MKKIFLTLLLSFVIIGCETSTEENSEFPSVVDSTKYEEIANAWTDALNSQDIDLALSYFSDDAVWSFPNGVEVEGKEAILNLMQTTSSIWTSITNSDDTIYLALEGANEAGEAFKILMSWGDSTYANDKNSITIPYHNVIYFNDDNKMSFQGGYYDRTKFIESYDEDPIK